MSIQLVSNTSNGIEGGREDNKGALGSVSVLVLFMDFLVVGGGVYSSVDSDEEDELEEEDDVESVGEVSEVCLVADVE